MAIGDGLGLFISSRIAKILDLNLDHRCDKKHIPAYNVPLMKEYLARFQKIPEFRSDPDKNIFYEEVKEEMERLEKKQSGVVRRVINCDYKTPVSTVGMTDEDLLEELRQPTWRVRFFVEFSTLGQIQYKIHEEGEPSIRLRG